MLEGGGAQAAQHQPPVLFQLVQQELPLLGRQLGRKIGEIFVQGLLRAFIEGHRVALHLLGQGAEGVGEVELGAGDEGGHGQAGVGGVRGIVGRHGVCSKL